MTAKKTQPAKKTPPKKTRDESQRAAYRAYEHDPERRAVSEHLNRTSLESEAMSADEPTTSFWELWHEVSGNILFDTGTAAAMRDFLREQLAEPATTGWLLTETTLIAWDTKGGYRVLADTPEAIRAWMEQT